MFDVAGGTSRCSTATGGYREVFFPSLTVKKTTRNKHNRHSFYGMRLAITVNIFWVPLHIFCIKNSTKIGDYEKRVHWLLVGLELETYTAQTVDARSVFIARTVKKIATTTNRSIYVLYVSSVYRITKRLISDRKPMIDIRRLLPVPSSLLATSHTSHKRCV